MGSLSKRLASTAAALLVCGVALCGCAGSQPAAYRAGYATVTAGDALLNRGVSDCARQYAAYGKGWNRTEWMKGCRAAITVQASGN